MTYTVHASAERDITEASDFYESLDSYLHES